MLYSTVAVWAALDVLAPELRVIRVPEEVAATRPWSGVVGAGTLADMIWIVARGAPAEAAGLKPGDRIRRVGGRLWASWRQLVGPPGTSLVLNIERQGSATPLEVTLPRSEIKGTYRDFPIYDVYQDHEGSIWMGMIDGEIIRADARSFHKGSFGGMAALHRRRWAGDRTLSPHRSDTRQRDLDGVRAWLERRESV